MQVLESTRYLPSSMSDEPLSIRAILDHAVRNNGHKTVVSRDGAAIVRYDYRTLAKRVARLANVLRSLGVGPGDRVASFAWNSHRHLELYYAVPMIGAVLHTVNIRLFADQVAFVLDHAGDRIVFADGSLVPALDAAYGARAAGPLPTVVMGTPKAPLAGAHDYETLLAAQPERYDFPEVDERAAALICYTSATTGDPKAVAFSHRSTYLHALQTLAADSLGVTERDRVLPIVPMFHVNAWGLPFTCPMVGADLVMPAERLDPAGVIELVAAEGVTVSAGVPTVWLGVREALRSTGTSLPSLNRIIIGGAAMPASLMDDLAEMGIEGIHAWGMTEMSPIGTVNAPVAALRDDPEAQRKLRYKQGRFVSIVAWRVVDEHGNDVPADGRSRGELLVRGPAIAREYFNNPQATASAFTDGWFHTGDVVTVDPYGYMEIVDRVKDFIKSGGEWISSVDLENTLMGHAAVREACVFGIAHPKWIERPVAAVVLRDGAVADEESLRGWLGERVAKWQIPDRVLFVEAIPRTGVGKFLKRELRERYAHLFSEG